VLGNGKELVPMGSIGIPWEQESEYRFARIWEWEYRYGNGNIITMGMGMSFPKLNGNQLLFAQIAYDVYFLARIRFNC